MRDLTVAILQRRKRREPWTPTPRQLEAAIRLASANGGFVLSHDDGTTDLLTHEGGGVHRYTIRPSGDVTLAASEPPTRRYARGDRLTLAGMLLSFGTVVLAFFVEVAERILYGENLPIPALAVLIPFFIGLAAFGVGSAMASVPFPLAGKRWTRIGGPDH